jgi:hypothetical protein
MSNICAKDVPYQSFEGEVEKISKMSVTFADKVNMSSRPTIDGVGLKTLTLSTPSIEADFVTPVGNMCNLIDLNRTGGLGAAVCQVCKG